MRGIKTTSLLLAWAATTTALKRGGAPPCRFALQYTQDDILNDPTDFMMDLLYWEGQFHQNSVGYNTLNGMSYDGTQIDLTTGLATAQHNFSAASKEVSGSLQGYQNQPYSPFLLCYSHSSL
jgi:hypothetical protein